MRIFTPIEQKLRRQDLAALGAAAGEHLTTVLGLHARMEAMHLRALTLLGLVSHPHVLFTPFYRKMETLLYLIKQLLYYKASDTFLSSKVSTFYIVSEDFLFKLSN